MQSLSSFRCCQPCCSRWRSWSIRRIATVVTIATGIVSWRAVARITRAEFRIRELLSPRHVLLVRRTWS